MAKPNCKKRWGNRYHNIIDNYMICTNDMTSEISEICMVSYITPLVSNITFSQFWWTGIIDYLKFYASTYFFQNDMTNTFEYFW